MAMFFFLLLLLLLLLSPFIVDVIPPVLYSLTFVKSLACKQVISAVGDNKYGFAFPFASSFS
jgi:hypothetical protein